MEVTAALAGTTAFPIPQGATTADPVPFMQQQANERPAAAAAAAEQERQRQQRHEPQGVKGWAQRESSPQQGQPTQQQSPQQQSPQQRQQEQQEQGEGDELQQESEETEKPRPQRPKGPPSEEERQRVREKYRERLRERKLQIYQRALQEVIHREKEDAQTRLLFKIHLPTRVRGWDLLLLLYYAALYRSRVVRASHSVFFSASLLVAVSICVSSCGSISIFDVSLNSLVQRSVVPLLVSLKCL